MQEALAERAKAVVPLFPLSQNARERFLFLLKPQPGDKDHNENANYCQ
jgi:hypothetical protein